jgi:hypothetical protein
MDPTLEITAMPAPQWLFGYEISEEQRLLFARLYLEYARSLYGPLHEQPRESLSVFLDRCTERGLRLAVPRELAIDILRRPDVFGWAHPIAEYAALHAMGNTRSVFDRGRAFFAARRITSRR